MHKSFSVMSCRKRSFYVLLPTILLFFTGCGTTKITVSSALPKHVDKSTLKRVAVVPFDLMLSEGKVGSAKPPKLKRNASEGWAAYARRKKSIDSARKANAERLKNMRNNSAKVVTDLFISELFSVQGIEVFTVNRIEIALRNMALDPDEVFEKSTAQEVANILGLDAFFTGKVFSYSYNKSSNQIYDTSSVSISVSLTSAKTGAMIWVGREAMQGQPIDLGIWLMRTPSAYELASKAIKNIVASFKNSLD